MSIRFTKMHALGNDFMVIDAINQSIPLSKKWISQLSNRHTGIGFDQCLLVEKSNDSALDFFYRIFNADGGEVGQCANGVRCLARFVHHYGLTDKKRIRVGTKTTVMELCLHEDETVTVNMGKPRFDPADIPVAFPMRASCYRIPLSENSSCEVYAVSVGNPHAVMLVADIYAQQFALGKAISEHSLFPEQTNVGFMEIVARDRIKLRVYERGVGETLACGSGAVAAVVIGQQYHSLAETVTVELPQGTLEVCWKGEGSDAYLSGPALFVYEGVLQLL